VSIGPLQIGHWPLTATSVSTHCLQNVACPLDQAVPQGDTEFINTLAAG